MNRIPLHRPLACLLTLLFSSVVLHAQSPGLIVRPAGGPGPLILNNPSHDSWTSLTSAGFTTSDITQSEIGYKIIRPISTEPTGDLATGPNGGYSDIVKTLDGSGCYMFYDGTNILFRVRIGSIVSGAKAYNFLFDTDLKLGATGPDADPNYLAPTNSGNGNPGFEREVALETGTNGRVAVYNVDGISPALLTSFSLATNHLISVALTRESNDADYFYDFFIPRTALGIAANAPFRIVVTTNTNPGSAFQGTRSDIYGLNDALFPNTTDAWQYAGQSTPSFTLDDVSSSGSGPGPVCTAPPVLNTGISAGTNITVSGTWTRLDATKPSTATITIFKNGVSQGSTSCASSESWNFIVGTIAAGDIITAQAQATGESSCLLSNRVAALTCSPASISSSSSAAFGTCVNNRRGMAGTKLANATIRIYQVAYNATPVLYATDGSPVSPSTFNISYGSPSLVSNTTWEYNGENNSGSADPCSGGPNDIPNGSYYITVTEAGNCESAPIWGSCVNSTATTAPTITQTVLYTGTNTISGNNTQASPVTIRLFVNGFLVASSNVAASAGYSFPNVALQTGEVVTVRAQAASQCISAPATLTTTCFSSAPTLNTDIQGNLNAGATSISGASSEPNGTTIRVFQSPSTLLATTTVSGGSWTATVPALVNGASYYATAQNGSCSVSPASSNATARTVTTACPVISGSYTEGQSTVTGTLSPAFTGTVYLYQDGAQIGSTAVTAATSWNITVNPDNPLYTGGVLTTGAQVSGGTLNRSCPSSTTVTCSAPAAPTVSPLSTTISAGQTVTYTITGTTAGVLYSVMDNTSGISYSASKFGNGADQPFTTQPFNTPGTYTLRVEADKLSGSSCRSSVTATLTVSGTLPVSWTRFTAEKQQSRVLLQWTTASEINSRMFDIQHSVPGGNWVSVGQVPAAGNSTATLDYRFVHEQPATGVNQYRLVQYDLDNRPQYSRIVTVYMGEIRSVKLFPNPVRDGFVFLQLPAKNQVEIFQADGKLVYSQLHPAGLHRLETGHLPAGIYWLRAGTLMQKMILLP